MRKILASLLALQLLATPLNGYAADNGVTLKQPEQSLMANVSTDVKAKPEQGQEISALTIADFPLIGEQGFVTDLHDSVGATQSITFMEISQSPGSSDDMNIRLLNQPTSSTVKDSIFTLEFYKEEAGQLIYGGSTSFDTYGYGAVYLNTPLSKQEYISQPYLYVRVGVASTKGAAYYSDSKTFKVVNSFSTVSAPEAATSFAVISNESLDPAKTETTGTFSVYNSNNIELNEQLDAEAYRVDLNIPFDPTRVKSSLINKSINSITPNYMIGDSKSFWVKNLNSNADYQITARLAYSGTKANVWVHNQQITDTDAYKLGNEFDNNIYSSVTTNFGNESDVNNDGKVNILTFDIQDGYSGSGGYTGGYFYAQDLYNTTASNQSEIFYVDTYPSMGTTSTKDVTRAYETVAHEFQHMVNYNQNVLIEGNSSMDTWLNEGLSMAAEQVYTGKGLKSRVEFYNSSTSIRNGHSLLYWDYSNTLPNYSLSYLFLQYIKIQAGQGDAIFKEIMNHPSSNYLAVEDIAKKYIDPNITFGQLMTNFRLALLLKESTGLRGFKGEPFFDLLSKKIYSGTATNLRGGGAIVKSYPTVEGFIVPTDKGNNVTYTLVDSQPTQPQNTVSGGIYEDTTWTKAKSPYIVTGEVVVFPDVTLTIEPGTVVKFVRGTGMEVRGTLLAEGTDQDWISFTSDSGLERGYWNGIEINNNTNTFKSSARFQYVNLSNAKEAVNLYGSWTENTMLFDHLKFTNNVSGLFGTPGLDIPVTNSTFEDNTEGIRGSNFNVYDSQFTNNGTAVSHDVNVYSSGLRHNDIAISGSNAEAKFNIIEENEIGIYDQTGTMTIYANNIKGNDIGLEVYSYGSDSGSITNNNIYNNYSFNVKNGGYANRTMMHNWWGSTDATEISRMIHDGYDDISLGLINFKPILNTSVVTTDTEAPTWGEEAYLMENGSGETYIEFFWSLANDNMAVKSYHIYVDSLFVGQVAHPSQSFRLSGLTPGKTYKVEVWAEDFKGNFSTQPLATTVRTVDYTPPAAPNTQPVTDASTSVTGTAEPFSTIKVKTYNYMLGQGTVNADGTFSVTIPKQYAGTLLSVTATDASGNTSVPMPVLVEDVTAPSKPLVHDVTDQTTTVSGYTEMLAKVEIRVNGSLIGEGVAGAMGEFHLTIPSQKAGTELVVTATDTAGQVSEATKVVVKDGTPPVKPVVDIVSDQSTALSGQTEAGVKVEVMVNGTLIGSSTAGMDGKFNVIIPVQKAGTELVVTAKDTAGNSSEPLKVTVLDNTVPEKPVVNEVTDKTTIVTGQAEPGSLIELKVNGTLIASNTVKDDGSFSVIVPVQKAGTELAITSTDKAGHVSDAVKLIVKDATAPVKPTVNVVTEHTEIVTGQAEAESKVDVKVNGTLIGTATTGTDGKFSVTIAAQKAGVELVITATDLAGNISEATKVVVTDNTAPTRPVVNEVSDQDTVVVGQAEAGSNIQVKVNGTVIGSGTVGVDGKFIVTIPSQRGGTELMITATDTYKNVSEAVKIVVSDLAPPAQPSVNIVTDKNSTVTGYAEADSKVEVRSNGILLGFTTAGQDDKFTVTIPVQKAGVTLVITATDAAGKVSEETKVVVKDVTAPAKPVVNEVNDKSTTVTGQAEAGSEIEVWADGLPIGSGVTGADGKFSITIAIQPYGKEIIVTARDSAGNVSEEMKLIVIKTALSGWVKENGFWYYYDSKTGQKKTGWLWDGAKWYYLDSTGKMLTGWLLNSGKWYFLEASGAMKTGWLRIGSDWYFLEASGIMKTGWVYDSGFWYYMTQSGVMKKGWLQDGGNWYYLMPSGNMATNTTIDGYRLGRSGAWIR